MDLQEAFFNGFFDEFEKTAFALSRSGHALDKAKAEALAKAHHGMSKAEGEYRKASPVKAHFLRGGMETAHRLVGRHQDIKAKRHEKGRNVYNPFKGWLTKSRQEEAEEKAKGKK